MYVKQGNKIINSDLVQLTTVNGKFSRLGIYTITDRHTR